MRITNFPMLSEIKEEYIKYRQDGQSRAEATQSLIHSYRNEITMGQDDDGLLFWIGLADAQYYRKELTAEAAQKASDALDRMEELKWDITPGDITRRRTHYAAAPMPERKVGKPRPKFRCSWNIGDVFAFKLVGEHSQKLGITGNYMLYQKVDEVEIFDGRIIPIVTLGFCHQSLPGTADEFLDIPHLILSKCLYGELKGKFSHKAQLVIDSNKQIERNCLQFLGNYPLREYPDDGSPDIDTLLPLAVIEMLSCAFWEVDNYFRHLGAEEQL